LEIREVLDDRDLGSEEYGVNRSAASFGRIDVQRIDAHTGDLRSNQAFGGRFGQIRMLLEIRIGTEQPRVVGPNEDCAAGEAADIGLRKIDLDPAASRERCVPTRGTGRPGYVSSPSRITWLRSMRLTRPPWFGVGGTRLARQALREPRHCYPP
jgi:hypothetical protein